MAPSSAEGTDKETLAQFSFRKFGKIDAAQKRRRNRVKKAVDAISRAKAKAEMQKGTPDEVGAVMALDDCLRRQRWDIYFDGELALYDLGAFDRVVHDARQIVNKKMVNLHLRDRLKDKLIESAVARVEELLAQHDTSALSALESELTDLGHMIAMLRGANMGFEGLEGARRQLRAHHDAISLASHAVAAAMDVVVEAVTMAEVGHAAEAAHAAIQEVDRAAAQRAAEQATAATMQLRAQEAAATAETERLKAEVSSRVAAKAFAAEREREALAAKNRARAEATRQLESLLPGMGFLHTSLWGLWPAPLDLKSIRIALEDARRADVSQVVFRARASYSEYLILSVPSGIISS